MNLSDIQTNSNFISYLTDNDTNVNNVVTTHGNKLPTEKYTSSTFNDIKPTINFIMMLSDGGYSLWLDWYDILTQFFKYENYVNVYKPWIFMNILKSGTWNLDIDTINKIQDVLVNLCKAPKNEEEFNNYYNIYTQNRELNTNSYWYKLRGLMTITDISYNGYGYNIACTQRVPLLGETNGIPFDIQVRDTSSFFAIVSNNYCNANNKKSIPLETLLDVMQLPL